MAIVSLVKRECNLLSVVIGRDDDLVKLALSAHI